jgi:hypothetical protein
MLATAAEMIEKYGKPEVIHIGLEYIDRYSGLRNTVSDLPEEANDLLITGNCLSCNGVFFAPDIADEHRFNPDRHLSGTEDFELWLRLASRYPFMRQQGNFFHCSTRSTKRSNGR